MFYEELYKKVKIDETYENILGFNPYYREITSGLGEKVHVDSREMIDLASNNYLGLANDERVKEAAAAAVKKYGVSLCGTPAATGYIDLYKRLEKKLSQFVGLEDTIIFPSCYQANNGLFSCIAGKKDIIIVDRFAHSSLIQGIKGAQSKIRPFLHNNLEHLEGILKHSAKYRNIFVITESVFSTDGSIAPFNEIIELCNKYNALPIIDDSHGIGVLGENGRGVLEEQNISEYRGIYTASLGKAMGNFGGIICGDAKLIKYLKYYCPQLVYSTALPPAVLAGIEKVLEIMNAEFELIKERLNLYKQKIYDSLLKAGFNVVQSETPINSIMTGTKENTIYYAKLLYENGILSIPFVEPSVPINKGKVRLIAGANLSQDIIQEVAEIIKGIGNR